jgi:hypothetical protein
MNHCFFTIDDFGRKVKAGDPVLYRDTNSKKMKCARVLGFTNTYEPNMPGYWVYLNELELAGRWSGSEKNRKPILVHNVVKVTEETLKDYQTTDAYKEDHGIAPFDVYPANYYYKDKVGKKIDQPKYVEM